MTSAGTIRSEINVTPLVDIVLVLLIIFMVITPLLQQGYSLSLPPTQSADRSAPDGQIVVSVMSDGSVRLGRDPISREGLFLRLADILHNRRQETVFLAADDAANYGATVEVMDIIRRAGAARIGIAPGPSAPVE